MFSLFSKKSEFKINFVAKKNIFFIFSAVICSLSVITPFIKGLNFGIDFRGGTLVEMRFSQSFDLANLRSSLNKLAPGSNLQTFGQSNDILAKIPVSFETTALRQDFIDKLSDSLSHLSPTIRRIETIGPKVSTEALWNAVMSTAIALFFMLIYVWVRFEWQFALSAVLALIHDSCCVFGLYSIFNVEFNFTSMVALLITIGYSINDTVVIFDRLREKRHIQQPATVTINSSINQTLSRTTLTSASTLISLLSLFLFGGPIIATYSLPILVGVIFGTYSSICIAPNLLLFLRAPLYQAPVKKLKDEEKQFEV